MVKLIGFLALLGLCICGASSGAPLDFGDARPSGGSWSRPHMIDHAYPIYFPGACIALDEKGVEAVMVQYSGKDGLKCRLGRWTK